jgi:hypothetical protein
VHTLDQFFVGHYRLFFSGKNQGHYSVNLIFRWVVEVGRVVSRRAAVVMMVAVLAVVWWWWWLLVVAVVVLVVVGGCVVVVVVGGTWLL